MPAGFEDKNERTGKLVDKLFANIGQNSHRTTTTAVVSVVILLSIHSSRRAARYLPKKASGEGHRTEREELSTGLH